MNFTIKSLSAEEFTPLYEAHHDDVFEEDHSYRWWNIVSSKEQEKARGLGKNMGTPFKLYLAAFNEKEEFIGWSWGFQESFSTYYMCNSAVLEPYRGQGIYSDMLEKSIELLKEEGFQEIYSRHNSTNNAVIIPKLKKGFIITKMEMSDLFGVLVHLCFYTNPKRRKMMDYRAGQISPDEEIKEMFKAT